MGRATDGCAGCPSARRPALRRRWLPPPQVKGNDGEIFMNISDPRLEPNSPLSIPLPPVLGVNGDGNRDGLPVPNRLSLDTQVRALADRLLERFAVTVGDLRASARTTTPGGLYGHWKSRSRLWRLVPCRRIAGAKGGKVADSQPGLEESVWMPC
jgi:hypothetical protein